MALPGIVQPEFVEINEWLRLRKYDGQFERFLVGYQNPIVYQNSEGIFDESKIPDLDYMERMCGYLSKVGELYYIEVREDHGFVSIGDVTIKDENPPIAIWLDDYRGKGIGTLVMQTVIRRLRELGFQKVKNSTVYRWNEASQKMHEKLGFYRVGAEDDEIQYELNLC